MFNKKSRYNSSIYSNCFVMLSFACFLLFVLACNNKSETFLSPLAYDKAHDAAVLMYDNGQQDAAVKHIDSAYKNSKQLDLSRKFNYYLFDYSYYSHYKNDKKRALLYADSTLNLFDTKEKKIKYSNLYGQAHFFKGDILFDQAEYTEAYQYFYRGKVIGNNNLDECIVSDYSYRMAMIMYKQENYKLAAANFKNSFKEINGCPLTFNSFYRRQEVLNNTGLSYGKVSMTDSALYFYDRALRYIDKYSGEFKSRPQKLDVARGVVYGNQANIYIDLKNYELAKTLLKKSISINLSKDNDNQDAQFAELKLAQLYNEQNQTDSLYITLDLINRQFTELNLNDDEAKSDWNNLMSGYYAKKGQNDQAMKYYVKYDALKDSINKKNKLLKEADIAEQIKRLEKDNEFDRLKKNNQQQNIYLIVTVLSVVMLVVIISLVFFNWQKSKKNIITLGGLNNQINDQNHHLEYALEELKQNSQEKDRILRTVAHDLRNPIGGIASLTTAMGDDQYNEEQREMLNLIKETSFNSLELINEILEATNTSAVKLNAEMVEINGLLNNSAELLKFKAAEKNQAINLNLLNYPLELMISREKIWRVVSNLISNAIKFSPAGAAILVGITDLEKEVQVFVKDNGIGIPDKLKGQVFNMFTDAKRPGTEGEKSFGLGLSICQQIVEKHNGRIWFDSDTENGTTFYFSLPK